MDVMDERVLYEGRWGSVGGSERVGVSVRKRVCLGPLFCTTRAGRLIPGHV